MTHAVAIEDILRAVRRVELQTVRLADSALAGAYHAAAKGRGLDFEELREYAPGDDVRDIDPNATARHGKPFVKVHREERALTLVLAVDISASCDFGTAGRTKRELAAEAAATLAAAALRTGDRVALYLFTDDTELYLPPGKGRRHLLRLIREMLFYRPARRAGDPGKALDRLDRMLRRRTLIALFSDLPAPAPMRPLARLHAGHDLVCLLLRDARELTLPDIGLVTFEDAETGEQAALDTGDAAARSRFEAAATAAHNETEIALARAGIDAVTLDTRTPFIEPLRRFFQSRRRRA